MADGQLGALSTHAKFVDKFHYLLFCRSKLQRNIVQTLSMSDPSKILSRTQTVPPWHIGYQHLYLLAMYFDCVATSIIHDVVLGDGGLPQVLPRAFHPEICWGRV